jgi:hypothetical protein
MSGVAATDRPRWWGNSSCGDGCSGSLKPELRQGLFGSARANALAAIDQRYAAMA